MSYLDNSGTAGNLPAPSPAEGASVQGHTQSGAGAQSVGAQTQTPTDQNSVLAERPGGASGPGTLEPGTPSEDEPALTAEAVHKLPHVRVGAGQGLAIFPIQDLWRYRELCYFFVWRDLKVRYKQTALGVLWAILQPLAATLIIALVFGRFAGGQQNGSVPYPLYVFSGMLPWTFFSNAVTSASNSLLGNTNLITKVYFPRLIIPTTSIGAGLVDFCMGLALLPGLYLAYGATLNWHIIFLPLLTLLLALLALAVGVFTSAASVQYRDVRHILPFAMQLWMFASPIIYQRSLVPQQWLWVLDLNPLSGILATYRTLIVGEPLAVGALLYSCAFTAVALVLAAWFFRRMERSFADII